MTNPNKLRRIIPTILLVAAGSVACGGGTGGDGEKPTFQFPQPPALGPATCEEIRVSYNPQDPFHVDLTLSTLRAEAPGEREISQVNYNFGDGHTEKGTNTRTFHRYETPGRFTVNAGFEIADPYHNPLPKGGASCPPVEVVVPHS